MASLLLSTPDLIQAVIPVAAWWRKYLRKALASRFDRPPGDPRCDWFDQLTIADGSTPTQLSGP
jgi:hypothetical protein